MNKIMNNLLKTFIFLLLVIQNNCYCKSQTFYCNKPDGKVLVKIDCENIDGIDFVKSDDFDKALQTCNGQLTISQIPNCNLAFTDFSSKDGKCDNKQSYHCMGRYGMIPFRVSCNNVNGTCVVDEEELDKARLVCQNSHGGKLVKSAIERCKDPY